MIRAEDFDYLARLLKERSGLAIERDKIYLLESRLLPLALKRGMAGIEGLVTRLRAADQRLAAEITEAMTTNESFFFRDQTPFDQFRDYVLPRLIAARGQKRTLRIWSAACSSGQEPYSLAMMLREEARLQGWRIEILATDLSREMIERARKGSYSPFEVQRGLPPRLLARYFKKDGDNWRITPELRAGVQFREHNLLGDLRSLGQFDVIFCRNVLIYFDLPTKQRVLDAIACSLPPDGFLFLGGAETVVGISAGFSPVLGQRGVYAIADSARDDAGPGHRANSWSSKARA